MKTEYVRCLAAKASTMAMLPPPMEYTAPILGVAVQGSQDETAHGLVEAIAVVDLDHGAVGVAASHRALEPHLSFFLAAEEPSTQSDQHVSRPVTQPLAHEIRGGRARSPVVHSDVGQPLAAGKIGHQGHDRDSRSGSVASRR